MNKLKDYKLRFKNKFPDSIIQIIGLSTKKYKHINSFIYARDNYGVCEINFFNLLKTNQLSIKTALNKKEYFITKYLNKFPNCIYNFSKFEYNEKTAKSIVICPVHGEFLISPSILLYGVNCRKCSYDKNTLFFTKNLSEFIDQANKVHHFKYNYDKTIYIKDKEKLKITCNLHGDFLQLPNAHLQGQGCKQCSIEDKKLYPGTWSLSSWLKTAQTSKDFNGFKVYIIKCWNETEEFYKIGRTFKKVKARFSNLPYNYEIIKEIVGDAKEIYKLELELKRKNKEHKYIPHLQFGGMHECFKRIVKI